ncbi:MAG: antibiotic biosynthesis monooxygenase [Defluviitaleaceae bacterium]|nr:antibiotic biosynthesis monooxygenase [Defluviitaleaceae bacterium]
MIVLLVQFEVAQNKHNEVFDVFKNLVKSSQEEEGCIEYDLYQELNDPNKFSLIEKWKDQAAIDFHNSTPHFLNNIDKVKELAGKSLVVNRYGKCDL